MRLVDSFPSSYVVDVNPDWPAPGEEVISLPAYDKLKMHTDEFSEIRFYPGGSSSWVGRFERGQRKGFEDCFLTAPNPSQACVISSGAGYWVDVEQRRAINIECLPIVQAVVSAKHSLVLIATWSDLYAYSSSDLLWSLCHIANDDLRIEKIEEDTLTAVGSVMGGPTAMRVNLLTGQLFEESHPCENQGHP
jgi:hypothetical protein